MSEEEPSLLSSPSPSPSAAPQGPAPVAGQRPLLRLFLVTFVNLTAFGVAIPILPALCKSYGGAGLAVGLLFTLQALGQFVMAPTWGRISDRLGRRPTLMLTLACAIAVDIATAWTGSLWMLLVTRFVAGLLAGNVATATAYIADVTPLKDRSKGMAIIGISFGLGFTFGPAIGALTSHLAPDTPGAFGIGLPFLVSAVLNVLALALAAALLKEPSQSEEEREAKRESFRGKNVRTSKLLERPKVARLFRFLVGYSVAVTILETTFYYYMAAQYGYDERQVGLLFAGMGILAALVQGGMVGRLSQRVGDVKMTVAGGALLGVGLAVSTAHEALVFLVIWLAVAAIGRALIQPATLALMSAQARGPGESGALMGVVQSANSAGRIIGPLLGGWIFDEISDRAPFLAAGLIVLASTALWSAVRARDEA